MTSDQPVPGFNLNINGGRAGSSAILADGVNNTGVGIARAVVSFTPETVQESRCRARLPNAFDITTLNGLKLYRLRQACDTNFGALNAGFSQPRYIQFGMRIFF